MKWVRHGLWYFPMPKALLDILEEYRGYEYRGVIPRVLPSWARLPTAVFELLIFDGKEVTPHPEFRYVFPTIQTIHDSTIDHRYKYVVMYIGNSTWYTWAYFDSSITYYNIGRILSRIGYLAYRFIGWSLRR